MSLSNTLFLGRFIEFFYSQALSSFRGLKGRYTILGALRYVQDDVNTVFGIESKSRKTILIAAMLLFDKCLASQGRRS